MLETREGGCHCGRVRFRAKVDLDRLSQCNCTICTKKGILHLVTDPDDFELLRARRSDHLHLRHRSGPAHLLPALRHACVLIPRSQPDKITVNARCLDGIDGPNLKPTRFFDGRHWEEARRKQVADGGHVCGSRVERVSHAATHSRSGAGIIVSWIRWAGNVAIGGIAGRRHPRDMRPSASRSRLGMGGSSARRSSL